MRKFLFTTAACLGLASPLWAGPSIETARGTVELKAAPERLVVLDTAAIDTLQALGVPLIGMPGQQLLPYVDTTGTTPVGTLFEPDLEAIAGLAPDLIIIGGRSAAKYDAVAQVGPTVDMTMTEDLIPQAETRIATYGALFDKADKAAELQADLDARLAKLRAAAEGKGKLLVVVTNGPKMSAYGKGSRFGWIHDATRMPEAAEALPISGHGAAITQEFIAEKNPDWLFVLDRAAAIQSEEQRADTTLDTPLVQTTTAWSKGQVVYLPGPETYVGGGGYQALVRVIDAMTSALQGSETGFAAQ